MLQAEKPKQHNLRKSTGGEFWGLEIWLLSTTNTHSIMCVG